MTVPFDINHMSLPVHEHDGQHTVNNPTYNLRELYRVGKSKHKAIAYAKIFIVNSKK